MTGDDRATVLIVDDEPAYVAAFNDWLGDEYDVVTAVDGEGALEKMDETVDVVLLDRRMPGLSGDEVLERIRAADYDCRVAMITAAEPTVDVVDMAFDAYLTKPLSRDEIRQTVETLLARARLGETTRQCFSLAARKAALEAAHDPDELAELSEYERLRERLTAVESRADRALDDLLDVGALAAGYHEFGT